MARDKTIFKAQNIITGEILEGEISTIAELTGVQKQMIYKKALTETPYKEEWIFSKESSPVKRLNLSESSQQICFVNGIGLPGS